MSTMTEQEILRRMSACLNACRGIETSVLEGHSLGVIAATYSQRLHDAERQQQEAGPDAWMVTGNYTRVAFRSESSAKAYFGGLMQTDPEGGYEIKPLFLHPPKPAAQPQEAESEKLRKDAERYRYIREGNQWIVAATQTGCHIDGKVLDDLIDGEIADAMLSAAKEEGE